jgi:hypothetical protein
MGGPQRAYVFGCKLGADTREGLVAELRHFASEIERGEVTAGAFGGPSAGATYAFCHDPTMTHERYFAELDEWLDRHKNATPTSPAKE